MPTTRTYTAPLAGPVTLDVSLPAGMLAVHVDDRATRARVSVTTLADTGPSADAVTGVTFDQHGDHLTVAVPQTTVTVVTRSGPDAVVVSQNFGMVTGTVIGAMVMNGRSVAVGAAAVTDPITITITVPSGSSLACTTTAGHIGVLGDLDTARVRTASGDVVLGGVRNAEVTTLSGDITVDGLAGNAELHSMSGDIRVYAATDSVVTARSMSGHIRASGAPIHLDARSMSGRVITY